MNFKTLKDKQEYYRSLTDYRLVPNSYVLVMLDGRSFSKKIKNKFHKPFDERFVNAMNETTKYLCEQIEGCKFGYCQSDEISLVLSDFETPHTDAFFSYRLSKILSICASAATAKFNNEMMKASFREKITPYDSGFTIVDSIHEITENAPLYEFDCKAWNVPTINDVYGWFLHRQLDCVRNSKSQTAQAYLPHKELVKLNSDEQIQKLKEVKGVDWNELDDGLKYGRFVYHVETKGVAPDGSEYTRNKFTIMPGRNLNSLEGKEIFYYHMQNPKIEITLTN